MDDFWSSKTTVNDTETAAAVGVCAAECGLTETGEWSVIYRGTNTVLTNMEAQLCARIGPSYETISDAADTLNIVRMLVDCGADVQPAAKPEPGLLSGGRHVTFWELGTPVTDDGVTAGEYAAALRSVHCVPPRRRIRPQAGAATIRQGMLRHAASTDIPKTLLAETAQLFEQRLVDVNKYTHRNCAVLHGDAWTLNMVRDRHGQIRWVDLDQAGWGPVEWDLATCVFEARHYPTSNISESDVLGRYRLRFDSELVEACVRLRAASSAVFTCFMWGRGGSLEQIESRLAQAKRN